MHAVGGLMYWRINSVYLTRGPCIPVQLKVWQHRLNSKGVNSSNVVSSNIYNRVQCMSDRARQHGRQFCVPRVMV